MTTLVEEERPPPAGRVRTMVGTPEDMPSGRTGLVAVLAALAGVYLWTALLAGPARLGFGLLGAASHLDRAGTKLSEGAVKEARYDTFAAAAAARRARAGHDGPLFDAARIVPRAAELLDQADHIVRAAEHSSNAAMGTLTIGQEALEGGGSIFAEDPADPQGSIVSIDRLRRIAAIVSEVRSSVQAAATELARVEVAALPRRLRPEIESGIRKATEADRALADAEAGLAILPGVLGADEARTYLLGIQNPAEERGTGGALLQFSLLEIDGGRVSLGDTEQNRSSTVYVLDQNRTPLDIDLPPDAFYVAAIEDAQRFGNSNWSPNWPLSARLMIDYAQASDRRIERIDLPPIDGFIVVDPIAAQKMMPGVGPFRTKAGNLITTSRFIQFVLYRAYGSYPIPSDRRAVLSQVSDGLFSGAFHPKSAGKILRGVGAGLAEKHIQIWLKAPKEETFVERMDWDGSIHKARNSDYFYVVEQNVGGNKNDFFAGQDSSLDISFAGSDSVVSAGIEISNRVFLPQPRWMLGDSKSLHRPMMNVYVPRNAMIERAAAGPALIGNPQGLVDWAEGLPPEHYEADKKVWSATLEIPAEDKGFLRYDYTVPDVVQTRNGRRVYRLVVQHQPRVQYESMRIRVRPPPGASTVIAQGFERDGDMLVWDKPLKEDMVLEVSWRE